MRPKNPPDYPDDAIPEPQHNGRGALSNASSRFDDEKKIRTTDGWDITFDRVFLALGNEGLSDSCTVYGEADYDRVINLSADKTAVFREAAPCE